MTRYSRVLVRYFLKRKEWFIMGSLEYGYHDHDEKEHAFNLSISKLKSESGVLTIPDGVTKIHPYAFGCRKDIETVKIPGSVIDIDDGAFDNCPNLRTVEIMDGVKRVGHGVFDNCQSLQSVEFPDSIEVMGEKVFRMCIRLEHVTLPSGLTAIDSGMFSSCASLKFIDIPANVDYVHMGAFEGCHRLENVVFQGAPRHLSPYAFNGCERLDTVVIPEAGRCDRYDSFRFHDCDAKIVYDEGSKDLTSSESISEDAPAARNDSGRRSAYEALKAAAKELDDNDDNFDRDSEYE